MSRREVRRNKGRAALAFVMILFPALIMCLSVTLITSGQANGARKVPYALGDAQARVSYNGVPVLQSPDPEDALVQIYPDENDPNPEDLGPAKPEAVRDITGGTVAPFAEKDVRYSIGKQRRRDTLWRFDPQKITGRATLLSGRWANGPGEAVVTDYGITRGLPTSGTVEVTESYSDDASGESDDVSLTIVGTASARTAGALPALIAGEDPSSSSEGLDWFVTGADPVTWDKVVALNKVGYDVTSAEVLRDPPPESVWNPNDELSGSTPTMAWAVGLGGPFMGVVIALLVAPAFAVSAARSRRTLALAASNGATSADLRRTVLGQALIIGLGAAGVGAALGIGTVYVAFEVLTRRAGYSSGPGPDVPWAAVAFTVLVAVASAVVAALVPASRLGRLDIVSVMRGRAASPKPSRLLAGLGLLVVLASTVTLAGITRGVDAALFRNSVVLSVAIVAMILGGVFLVPLLLALVARAGGSFPMAGRIAARDMGRHRARSSPTVAAILAGAAALTVGLTGLASDTVQKERQYVLSALPGEGYASIYEGNAARTADSMAAAHPELTLTKVRTFDAGEASRPSSEDQSTTAGENRWFTVVPSGCTPEQTVNNAEYLKKLKAFNDANADKQKPASAAPTDPCAQFGVGGDSERFGRVGVLMMPADWIAKRLDLSAEQAADVKRGGVILLPGDDSAKIGKTVNVAWGTYKPAGGTQSDSGSGDNDPYDIVVTEEWEAPAIELTPTPRRSGELLGYTMAVASDAPTLSALPSTTGSGEVQLLFERKDGDPLDDSVAETLLGEAGDTATVGVERGFNDSTLTVTAIVVGLFAFLLMIVVLTSTALTLAEQQRDQTTLAAIGATRGTRRVMAGTQAFLIAGIGSLAGVLVGLLPGIAMARQLTTPRDYTSFGPNGVQIPETGAILVIPWWSLLAVVVLIPLAAGALAAIAVRRAPAVTRRPS